jgi:hypothetical protein
MEETNPSKFCDDVDVIKIEEYQLEDDSPLHEEVAFLVRQHFNSKPYIIINMSMAQRDAEALQFDRLEDYMTFIESHEVVHYLEDHLEATDENEYKADLYGTALCVLKGYPQAADIGMRRLEERYTLDDTVSECVRNAICDLQS